MKRSSYFWCGGLFFISLISLVEDWYGKEAYIAYVQEHWTSGYVTIPLALVIVVAIMVKIYRGHRSIKVGKSLVMLSYYQGELQVKMFTPRNVAELLSIWRQFATGQIDESSGQSYMRLCELLGHSIPFINKEDIVKIGKQFVSVIRGDGHPIVISGDDQCFVFAHAWQFAEGYRCVLDWQEEEQKVN